MKTFLLLTTKDESGCWFRKCIVRADNIDFVTTVFDEDGREDYNYARILFKDGKEIVVQEHVSEIYKMITKGGEE